MKWYECLNISVLLLCAALVMCLMQYASDRTVRGFKAIQITAVATLVIVSGVVVLLCMAAWSGVSVL